MALCFWAGGEANPYGVRGIWWKERRCKGYMKGRERRKGEDRKDGKEEEVVPRRRCTIQRHGPGD